MFVLDSHCDTPSELLRGRDLNADDPTSHVDFPKIERGGVDGAFFAIYIPASMSEEEAFVHAHRQLDALRHAVAENPDKASFAVSCAQALANKAEGRFSVFLGLENGSPLGCSDRSMEILDGFYSEGVRYMTLCHSEDNAICDSCASIRKRWNGLSPFGKEVVAHMNRIGMLVDVSHVSDASFHDVLEYSSRPVVATHSCCRALAGHPRNLTDSMIRDLASQGGVIQVNFYPYFLDSSYVAGGNRPSYKRIVDHVDHVVDIAGIDHVGLGSDFDGIEVTPEGMENMGMYPKIFDEMLSRGYSETDIEKVAGLNFFRLMQ